MTVGYPQEEPLYEHPMDYIPRVPPNTGPIRIDPFTITLLLILLFLLIQLLPDRKNASETPVPQPNPAEQAEEAAPVPETIPQPIDPAPVPVAPVVPDSATIVYPYDEYWVTQGPHGMSYGHMAIDLAAGKGAIVCKNRQEAIDAVHLILTQKAFGILLHWLLGLVRPSCAQ